MSRRSRRAELARQQVTPAAGDFVRTAADRVGPFAQSAAGRIGPLAEAAADRIGAAADRVSPLAHAAAGRVGPFAQSAADRVGPLAQTAAGRIAPMAGQAYERVTPYAVIAVNRVSPLAQTATGYAQTAAGRIVPLATTARQRSSLATAEAVRRIGPVFGGAVVRVSPAVEAARGKVTDDLLPRLTGALSAAAAANPLARGTGSVEAAPAELVVPRRGGSRGRWARRVAVIGALGAVTAVVVRRFRGGQDADWQAARPAAPYVPPPASTTSTTTSTSTDTVRSDTSATSTLRTDTSATDAVAVEEDFAATESAPMGLLNVTDSGDIEETVVDEVVFSEPVADLPERQPVTEPVTDEAPAASTGARSRWSGEGVYVGTEPPAGYVIKGNERSMKYHMPEAAGYSRTVAEVWFNSEEAAQQAGFVRAQR